MFGEASPGPPPESGVPASGEGGEADAAAEAAPPAAHTARHGPTARPKSDLMNLYATLATKRFIDLTHSFGPNTPH